MNSSDIYPQDFRHYRFFKRSRMICENGTSNLRNSQTGSSSCQCSTTSIGQSKETMEFVFRIQKKPRNTRRYSRRDTGRSSVLETTRSGMELFLAHLTEKWVTAATQVERFKGTGHAVFKSISASTRGILKKKNGRDTKNFNADASITELLFGIIHSVNELSIYGAVTNWCAQFGFTEEEKKQEKTERIRDQRCIDKCEITRSKICGIFSETGIWKQFAAKNQDFESLTETIRFIRVCEFASFRYRVSAGLSYKTRLDEDDGLGQIIPLCREYTLSRVGPHSRDFAAIPGGTIVWTSH